MIVLDASAAMEIVLSRPAHGALKLELTKASKVISSELFRVETANTIWKYVRSDYISMEKGNEILCLVHELVDEYIEVSDNIQEALNEAVRLNHPVYDLLYYTLARRFGARLMTLDRQLINLAEKTGIPLVL